MWKITPYEKKYHSQWEQFREQALAEGNDSLIKEKLDPENLDGILHLLWEDDKLASCQAAEVDHYTDNPTAIRMCRLHTLKEYRRTSYGMPLCRYQIEWSRQMGYEHVWWSVDVNRTGLVVPVGDPVALAEAFLILDKDRTLLAAMGKRGREKYKSQLTIEASTARVVGLYEDL